MTGSENKATLASRTVKKHWNSPRTRLAMDDKESERMAQPHHNEASRSRFWNVVAMQQETPKSGTDLYALPVVYPVIFRRCRQWYLAAPRADELRLSEQLLEPFGRIKLCRKKSLDPELMSMGDQAIRPGRRQRASQTTSNGEGRASSPKPASSYSRQRERIGQGTIAKEPLTLWP